MDPNNHTPEADSSLPWIVRVPRGCQNFTPWIHVTPTDFESITRNGAFCDEAGGLRIDGFERAMREQVLIIGRCAKRLIVSRVFDGLTANVLVHCGLANQW